jgi:hypothetical protein
MTASLPTGAAHVPRIVALLASLALLVWVNREAPRILPAILALVVLYAALTNVERAQALIGSAEESLAKLIHPSTPATSGGGAPRKP